MPAIPVRKTRTGETKKSYVSLYAVPHLIINSTNIMYKEKPHVQTMHKRMGDICKKVCTYFNVSEEELKGRCRLREVVAARHMFFFITSFITEMTLVQIGDFFNRDHTTVIHAREKMISFIQLGDTETIEALNTLCPPAIDVYCKSVKKIL